VIIQPESDRMCQQMLDNEFFGSVREQSLVLTYCMPDKYLRRQLSGAALDKVAPSEVVGEILGGNPIDAKSHLS